jgi:transcriptional regulator with XRE-family HTH domain
MAPTSNHHAEKSAIRESRAARLRAARAFADLDQADFAEALGVSVVTIKRMERGARDVPLDDLYALAKLCGVPRWFVDTDWQVIDELQSTAPEELRTLAEAFAQALDERFTALTDALLSRDEALAMSREALERLRSRSDG